MSPEDHFRFQAKIREVAALAVEDLPNLLETLKGQLRAVDPLSTLATIVYYGLTETIDDQGNRKRLFPEVEQHSAEFFQALMLLVPQEEWGVDPPSQSMTRILDLLEKLESTLPLGRIHKATSLSSQDRVAMDICVRMQLNTQFVRNWDHYSDTLKIATKLYSPLDARCRKRMGFSFTDLIKVMSAAVDELERRSYEDLTKFGNVLEGATIESKVNRYFEQYPDLQGTPEEVLRALPSSLSEEDADRFLQSHRDLRLPSLFFFSARDLASRSGVRGAVARAVLTQLSLDPGALSNTNPEYFFLDNPVWTKPIISLRDEYFFVPMPQATFSHLHLIISNVSKVAGIEKYVELRRASYLESQLPSTLASALPGAAISSNLKWTRGAKQFETDCVASIDRTLIVIEAKSSRLTVEGLRGAPQRIKRHVKELVLKPSQQSARFADVILEAKQGDSTASADCLRWGIDASQADRIIRLSVTLDDMSILYSAERELKEAGWIPEDHNLPTTVTFSDLKHIADILDNPLFFIHYFNERTAVQKEHHILGSETDLLGLYLENGLNLPREHDPSDLCVFAGMSQAIDNYLVVREVGVDLPKPKPKLSPLFDQIFRKLSITRPNGWTSAGTHLLSCSSHEEQIAAEEHLTKLRKEVRCNWRDPEHNCYLIIQPPQRRKAIVVFHLFPKELRKQSRQKAQSMAMEILDERLHANCCIFLKCVDDWSNPFEAYIVA